MKNVAYLFSDRSRALAHAYVLKKVRRHSFFDQKIGLYFFDFSIKKKGINNAFGFSEYSYVKINVYAIPKITFPQIIFVEKYFYGKCWFLGFFSWIKF